MMQKPTPRNGGLAMLRPVLVMALELMLLPPALAQGRTAQDSVLEPVDTQTRTRLLEDIQVLEDGMLRAFNAGDTSEILSVFSADAIALAPSLEALAGKGALHKQYVEDIGRGVKLQGIKKGAQRIWISGDWVYEVGPYAVSLTVPEMPGLITEFRTGVTILRRQPDGSLQIRVGAYNKDPVPPDPMDFGDKAPQAGTIVRRCATTFSEPDALDVVYGRIRQMEKAFHGLFVVGDTEKAIAHYADDAILAGVGRPVLQGRGAIAEAIDRDMKAGLRLTAINQDMIQVGGDANMVYVVSLFAWTGTDPVAGNEFTVSGKGVHLWQRQGDDAWRIVFDINNLDGPM